MVIVAINKHKETIVVFGVEYALYGLSGRLVGAMHKSLKV